jgi:DnaJ family protein C protein 3
VSKTLNSLCSPSMVFATLLVLNRLRFRTISSPVHADLRQLRSEAEIAAGKGDTAAAIKLWTQLLDAEPSQISYFHRASAYLKRHQHAHALSDLNRALELDSKFTKGLMFRAKVYKVTGSCEAAKKDLEALLAVQPTHKEATAEMPKVHQCISLIQQADNAIQQHQFEHAKQILTMALDIAYESHALLLKRIDCHVAQRDWQSVLVDTRKILQTDKGNTDALLIRGRAYYHLGETENALTHWKEGLRLDPEHRGLKESTKSLRLLLRRIANAEAVLHTNPQEALEEIDAALAMATDNTVLRPNMLLKKVEALLALKQFGNAQQVATESLSIEENADMYVKRADAKMGLQEWEQAMADYQKAQQMVGSICVNGTDLLRFYRSTSTVFLCVSRYEQNPQHQGAQQGLHQAQLEKKKSEQKDYYKELGIPRDANARMIKKVRCTG